MAANTSTKPSTSSDAAPTVFLVEEDDSQNGLDHVDAHRSIFFAISSSKTTRL